MAMKLVLEVGGVSYAVAVDVVEGRYVVDLPGGRHELDVRRNGTGNAISLLRGADSFEAWAVRAGEGYRVQVLGASYDIEVEDALRAKLKALDAAAAPKEFVVKAPMPGVVVELKAEVGDEVTAGEPLVIVEAMKMRNEFGSKIAGVVRSVHVGPGQSVERNTVLCVVVPPEEESG